MKDGGIFIYAAAGAVSSGAGAVSGLLSDELTLALYAISGMCAVVGALYFRANDEESALADLLISVVFAFVAGAGAGGTVGSRLLALLNGNPDYQNAIADYAVGGLIVGAVVAPVMRVVFTTLRDLTAEGNGNLAGGVLSLAVKIYRWLRSRSA